MKKIFADDRKNYIIEIPIYGKGAVSVIAIALCDDSDSIVADMSDLLHRYAREKGQDIKIYKYTSGIQLLEKYTGVYDLIFLDIKMSDMDGLETAKKIRKRDRDVSIIFLTSLLQHAMDGYSVGALNYIIKPINYKRLKMELDAWIHKKNQSQEPFIIVKNDDGSYKIMLNELTYIETANRNALIHTKDESHICYKKLKVLEAELKADGFSRCHSSYIVNLAYVVSVEQMNAKLITGEIIPISQKKRKDFMQSLARYWGERI